MASFKCKGYYKKKQASKLGMVDSGLRKENALLKKTMADMTCQQSEHNKLVGGFLSAEAAWLETFKQLVTKDEKCPLPPEQRDEQDQISCEVAHPHSVPSGDVLTSSPHTSLLNGSFLECPSCQAEYPASHYRELMNHVEICLD
ncbi:hypothetical protein GBF38_002304 [Nibea albiflora]|uniref:Uncharacterized protein n=1 Tax=Nibea albiflora TaxID=240163 RepID=A0ACB7EEK8_NIBAL|nr:hypothetical protein GBF38_002304 [Nibea albiflora]